MRRHPRPGSVDREIRRLRGADRRFEDADLCVRAARALQSAGNCTLGADIDVVKRIPDGCGFGRRQFGCRHLLGGIEPPVGPRLPAAGWRRWA